MATSDSMDSPPPPPSAQVVADAFVSQYYHILHQSPQNLHQFYHDDSHLSRPDALGRSLSVTTIPAINEKILSSECTIGAWAEVKTVDAQHSLDGGVLVVVTGCLVPVGGVGRGFTQSFFLAPQKVGFYVLNDIFRFTVEGGGQTLPNGAGFGVAVPYEQDLSLAQEVHHVQGEDEAAGAEAINSEENEKVSSAEEEAAVVPEVVDEVPSTVVAVPSTPEILAVPELTPEPAPPTTAITATTTTQKDVPKTFASIVKIMRDNPAPFMAPKSAPTRPTVPKSVATRPPPATNPESHTGPAPKRAQHEAPAAGPNTGESNYNQEVKVDGHSIYIRNLPLNVTSEQLEEELKKFGPIKPNGIQIRSNQVQGFCFAFVEFDVATAVQIAIEASPIMIGDRAAHVEEKRTTAIRSVNYGGRFAPRRGYGYRNDGSRGRGTYAGRGYERADFNHRADFGRGGGSRGGSTSNRGSGVGYQRIDQFDPNGTHRNPRNVPSRTSTSAQF